ncbi:MAG: hypothetical protein ACK4JY_01810 [Brevundimonas sp.]|uniref:hypothetical protein n=1 Tax=Brevundimonas sp. TaxID=1871086 RepID=UPI00391907D3
MLKGAFLLSFGGDEFAVQSFAVPPEPVAIAFNGRRRIFNEGRTNEYCLYQCSIADGAIHHVDGNSVGDTVFVTLPCELEGQAVDGRGTSAAIVDADDQVIPVGRAVILKMTP